MLMNKYNLYYNEYVNKKKDKKMKKIVIISLCILTAFATGYFLIGIIGLSMITMPRMFKVLGLTETKVNGQLRINH